MTSGRAAVWDPFQTEERQFAVFAEAARNTTTEVRESVSRAIQRRFPRGVTVFAEAFVTWVSGCPHRGQKPLVRRDKLVYTVEAFGGFAVAVVLGHVAVAARWWWVLPIQWLVLAGRTWALFNIFHHATHNTLFRSQRVNRALAFCSSIVSFSSSLEAYRDEHIRSHHTKAMCTYEDREAVFMPLGFPPGRPKGFYYRRLAWLILTPWTYLLYTRYRLWDWQRGEPLARRLVVWAYAATLVTASVAFGSVPSLLLAYVVPLFVVFNITGLLGTFSEHHWGTLQDQPWRLRLVLLQQSRFLLDAAPVRARGWVLWWLRLLCYHLPVRVAVLPGDSIHHDHHHRHPRTENWPLSTFERFDHVENGCPGYEGFPHCHAWSLGEAIDRVFTRMSVAPSPAVTKGARKCAASA